MENIRKYICIMACIYVGQIDIRKCFYKINLSQQCVYLVYLIVFLSALLIEKAYAHDVEHVVSRAYVTRIVDGDTLELKIDGEKEYLRLWGIDTPEWDQPFALQAKAILKKHLHHKRVEVHRLYRDDYNRIVAILFYNGMNINELLVERGYAWVHIYYCDKKICNKWRKLQQKAMQSKKGLWVDEDPLPPWRWKRNIRKN